MDRSRRDRPGDVHDRPSHRITRGLTGLPGVARLTVRRDRVLLAVWVAVMSALPNSLVGATAAAYPTVEERTA